jgi:ABC-2 type transport system permease protein
MREPLGFIGTVAVPVVVFIVVGGAMRAAGRGRAAAASPEALFVRDGLPVMAALLMAVSAVVSLVTIISIYRESGILKRLRATPLHPSTILLAHVLVKLVFAALTLLALVAAGRRFSVVMTPAQIARFGTALLFSTSGVLSIGFLIASLVPTARFAQPLASVVFYPMIAMSGLFFPLGRLPGPLEALARALPLTHAVSLLQGAWRGDPWVSHLGDLAAIAITAAVCTAVSARVFRWE